MPVVVPVVSWLVAATPSPAPTRNLEPTDVSPGLLGFLATFAVIVICALLIVDMSRRIRRLRFRQQAANAAAQADPPETDPSPGPQP